MVSGFLGAGKTTTIARLARMYQDRGQLESDVAQAIPGACGRFGLQIAHRQTRNFRPGIPLPVSVPEFR